MPEIISRKDAVALRLVRYFTGKSCKHGHVAERRTDTGNCIECQWLAQQTPERKAANILYKRRLRAEAIVAKNYAARRSELAKAAGLGHRAERLTRCRRSRDAE